MTPCFLFLILGPGRADLTLQALADASPAFFDSGYQEFDLDPPEPFGITLGSYGDGGAGMCSPLYLLSPTLPSPLFPFPLPE